MAVGPIGIGQYRPIHQLLELGQADDKSGLPLASESSRLWPDSRVVYSATRCLSALSAEPLRMSEPNAAVDAAPRCRRHRS